MQKRFFLNTIGYRFGIALDAVYGKSSTQKCVDDLGVSQSTIDRGKKGDSLTKTISIFAAKNRVSTPWLLTGEGEMLVNTTATQSQTLSGNHNNQAGGNISGHNNNTSVDEQIAGTIASIVKGLDINDKLKVLNYVTSLKI